MPTPDQLFLSVDVTCGGLSHTNPPFAIDMLELRDAAWEDASGRLPLDPDYDPSSLRTARVLAFPVPPAAARRAARAA